MPEIKKSAKGKTGMRNGLKKDIYIAQQCMVKGTNLIRLILGVFFLTFLFSKSLDPINLVDKITDYSLIIVGFGLLAYQLRVKTIIQSMMYGDFKRLVFFSLVTFVLSMLFLFVYQNNYLFYAVIIFFSSSIMSILLILMTYRKGKSMLWKGDPDYES